MKVKTDNMKGKKAKRYYEHPTKDNNTFKRENFNKFVKNEDQKKIEKTDKSNKLKIKKKSKMVTKPKVNPILKKRSLPKDLLDKHARGEKVDGSGVKTDYFKEKLKRKEIYLDFASEQAARAELLLTEQKGLIEAEPEEITAGYNQEEIAKNVDILAASKYFKLTLDYGPYSMRYTKNGRHLLLGGRKGHVAAFDWVTKKLACEISVMEEVADVTWLHVNTMFACAQKNWTFVYDSQGTELHCIKRMYRVNCMEFLPYHFLLATASSEGYLSWVDISIGELVGNYDSRLGDIRLMRQNPYNGILCVGGAKGVVTMWSPKVREPLSKLLVHPTPMSALTVDPKGLYMVTAGHDRCIKVWDVRQLTGPMACYKTRFPANQVEVSQSGMLACAQGNYCEIYSNILLGDQSSTPYLKQRCDAMVHSMRFCPYEDVLGVATAKGFQSLLVPGCGEPNYDAFEDNPFQTRKQRREHEVHNLLEKIPPELITLDPNDIANVDTPTLQEKIDAKRSLFYLKPPKIDFVSRRKTKGRGGSVKAAKNKQIVKDEKRKEFIKEIRSAKKAIIKSNKVNDAENDVDLESNDKSSVLSRFKVKKR